MTSTIDAENASFEMPYWATPAFHEAIKAIPFRQDDGSGGVIVNINVTYYKVVQDQIVSAPIPESLRIPDLWTPLPVDDFFYPKARSMLGLG